MSALTSTAIDELAVLEHRRRRSATGPPISRVEPDGRRRLELAVENITCAACIGDIERALKALDGVGGARVNYASRRVAVVYDPAAVAPEAPA